MIAAWLAKFALGRAIQKIPAWAWIALAVIVAVVGFLLWHGGKVEAYGNARYQAGVDAANSAWRASQAKADAKQTKRVGVQTVKQSTKAKESAHALTRDYADIDARVERMRRDAANRRSQGQPGNLPGAGAVAASAQCPTGQDGLPRSIIEPLLIEAARNQAQLNRILEHDAAQQRLADEFAAATAAEAQPKE